MLIAFLVAKETYKDVAPTYAWLARKALNTRPGWRQTEERVFTFEKTGESFVIDDQQSLASVVHLVIEGEMPSNLMNLPYWRQEDLLRLAHHEADKFLKPGRG